MILRRFGIKVWLVFLGIVRFLEYFEGYIFQCPGYSQWHIRAETICNTTEKYYCLLNDNNKKYVEFCRNSYDVERAGHKIIIVGSLQGEICNHSRYQPIKFWTNGNSDCLFAKSTCNEYGQIPFNTGSNKLDIACRCDYTKGYDFVNKPQNPCFCAPSEEDCSCYLKQCDTKQILNPDYRCVYTSAWKPPFRCAIIPGTESSESGASPVKTVLSIATSSKIDVQEYRLYGAYIVKSGIIMISTVLVTVAVVVILKRKRSQVETKGMEVVASPTGETEDKKTSLEPIDNAVIMSTNRAGVSLLREWKSNLRYFHPTAASEIVRRKVIENQCTLITGPPGCGKTAIAYYVALELETTEGYTIMPVSVPEEVSKLLEDGSYSYANHVLIVDNLVGLDTVTTGHTKDILKAIETALLITSSLKIIMTCRSHVYIMNTFDVDNFYHCDMLLSEMTLSLENRREMLSCYHKEDFVGQIGHEDLLLYNFFPALCALSVQTDHHFPTFFTYPFAFLKTEIERMRQRSDVLYLALAVMVVNNGRIEKKLLDEEHKDFDHMLQDIYSESGFQHKPTKTTLSKILKSINGTFLQETETSFCFFHDKLFHVISTIIGGGFVRSIIQDGNPSLINERLQLTQLHVNESFNQLNIMVNPQLENLYFERLLLDLSKGYLWCSLKRNIQIKHHQFRQKLIQRLEKNQKLENVKDIDDDSTLLHVTSYLGYHNLFLHFLKNNELEINKQNKAGKTALHVACEREMTMIVKSLIKKGAAINVMDTEKRTALHLACKNGNRDIVELLLSRNAEINNPDCNGLTPLHIACSEGHFDAVNILLQYNSDIKVNFKDNYGRTPFFIACEMKNDHHEKSRRTIELLLHHEVDINCQDIQHKTPLHILCMHDDFDTVLLLLKSNAKVNLKDKLGQTPIFKACLNNNISLTKLLIEHKADLNVEDNKDKSVKKIALQNDFVDLADVFRNLNN